VLDGGVAETSGDEAPRVDAVAIVYCGRRSSRGTDALTRRAPVACKALIAFHLPSLTTIYKQYIPCWLLPVLCLFFEPIGRCIPLRKSRLSLRQRRL